MTVSDAVSDAVAVAVSVSDTVSASVAVTVDSGPACFFFHATKPKSFLSRTLQMSFWKLAI